MMTYSMKDAFAIHEAMNTMNISGAGSDLKGRLGLIYAYNFRILHEALGEYLNVRNKIIKKYADDPDAAVPSITDEKKLEQANEEISKYADLNIDLPVMEVTMDDLEKASDASTNIMSIMLYFCPEMNTKIGDIKTPEVNV